jgi:O-antigen/teichoic acid export membrane protein
MIRFWNTVKNNLGTVRNISAIGIADLVSNTAAALLWLYLASIMLAEDYGTVHYYIAIANIAAAISLLGSENMLRVYIPKQVKIQATVHTVTLVSGAICSLVLFFIYYKVELIFLTLGLAVNSLAISQVIGHKQFSTYSKFSIIQKLLFVIFAVSLYYVFGKDGVLYGLSISFIPFIYQIYIGFRESKVSFVLIRERLSFFLTNFAYVFSGVARGQVDKIIIAPLLGFELLGNYSFALQIVAVLMILPYVIYKYTVPIDAGGNKSTSTVKKITILFSVIVSISTALVSPLVISFFFPKYTLAIQAIQILSLHPIPATIGLMISSKFLSMEKNKIMMMGTVISLSVNIAGVVILGPILGIIGTSLAFVMSSTANCVYLIIMNNKMKSDKSAGLIS